MKVTLIPSSMSPEGVEQNQYLISYLFDDQLAIDAGSLGFYRTPAEQSKIKDVLISHTHSDHVASLAIFIENCYEGKPDCVTVHGSTDVLQSLQSDIFNGRIWPDFIGMSKGGMPPFLKLNEIKANRQIELAGLKITPISVDHIVPTLGFVVEGDGASVIIASDTGPTDEIWQVARSTPNLKAVFLEVSFPDSMSGLADISKHLTPATFALEVKKLGRADVEVVAVHIKPRFRPKILDELHALNLPNLVIGHFNATYDY